MCETLEPFSICGFGSCVNGSCVCDPGIVQNLGFLYRDVQPDIVAYCDYNPMVMYFLAGVVLLVSSAGLVLQVRSIRNRRQFKRLVPLMIGYTLLVVSSAYRIALIDDSLFGRDAAYTFIVSNATFLILGQFVIYINKYVDYLLRLFYLNERTRYFAKGMLRASYVSFVSFGIGANLFFVAIFVESRATQLTLAQVGSGIYSVLFAYYLGAGSYLFTAYINDLRTVIKSDDAPERSDTEHSSTFADRCRKMLPRIKRVRLIFFIATVQTLFVNAAATFYEGWLKMWMWMLWVMFSIYTCCSIYVLMVALRARDLKERFRRSPAQRSPSYSIFTLRKRNTSKGSDSITSYINPV